MSDPTGQIVLATAGRDRDGLYCVVGTDPARQMLLLADGKRRRAVRPKAKKARHVRPADGLRPGFDHPTIQKLKEGTPVSDRELRRALAAFKEGITLGERRYD